MLIKHIFPYEYIEKGARVIIYGYGLVGKLYIEQIEYTKWCVIVGIVDSNVNRKQMSNYTMFSISDIGNIKGVDNVVIAIENPETADEVYNSLSKYGIDPLKIINCNMRQGMFPLHRKAKERDGVLEIALKCRGGLGDIIVTSSVYEKLVEMLPKIVIDIYGKKGLVENVYFGKENVRSVYNEYELKDKYLKYDAVLDLDHFIIVDYWNKKTVKEHSNTFYELLEKTREDPLIEGIPEDAGRYNLILERARLFGLDRFGMLGIGDRWDLSPELVKLILNSSFEVEYNKLGIKDYITVNYGTDKTMQGAMHGQTKQWPKKSFEAFIRLFKEKYPDVKIVQLGDSSQETLDYADIYILGESLELVKYVLKNSTLHFDLEGGLVHMATAMGTKCVVLFGPTPIDYYGYETNINISTGRCAGCFGLTSRWYSNCLKGFSVPECMLSITPDMVMQAATNYMESRTENDDI